MEISISIAIIGLAFISGITTIIGVVIAQAVCCKESSKRIVFGIGISTGIMILISVFELIPEAKNNIGLPTTFLIVVMGAGLIAVLNYIIPHQHIEKEEKGRGEGSRSLEKIAYLVAIGMILHDFPEGFAMANSYLISPTVGIFLAVAIAIHNIPEEFAIAVPLIIAGKKKSFIYKIALLSGLAEPLGAIFGLFLVFLFPSLSPYMLAFAAGAMIFVSLHELVPFANRYKKRNAFLLGIAASIIIFIALKVFLNV